MSDWYKQGYQQGSAEANKPLPPKTFAPIRFNVPLGEEKQIMFLDGFDTLFSYWERQYPLNGRFYNFTPHVTKNPGIKDPETGLTYTVDPLDEAFKKDNSGRPTAKTYHTGLLTVVDVTEGGKYRGYRNLFPAKYGHTYQKKDPKTGTFVKENVTGVADHLKKAFDKAKKKDPSLKDLTGCIFTVSRRDSKSPACGDEFEFERFVSPVAWASYAKEIGYQKWETAPWSPYDYPKIITAMPLTQLTALANEIIRSRNLEAGEGHDVPLDTGMNENGTGYQTFQADEDIPF